MSILDKTLTRILLLWRMIQYKFTNTENDFWGWLYSRATDPNSVDFERKRIAVFLVASAAVIGDHHRVCVSFNRFRSIVELTGNKRLRRAVLEAAKETNNDNIQFTV